MNQTPPEPPARNKVDTRTLPVVRGEKHERVVEDPKRLELSVHQPNHVVDSYDRPPSITEVLVDPVGHVGIHWGVLRNVHRLIDLTDRRIVRWGSRGF
jgi:hypothetical protein